MIWVNVEVNRCSQRDTHRAAVRFEGAVSKSSRIQKSVVHNGEAWSLFISNSRNINVIDSSFIGAKAVGVNLHSTTNVHLDGVFVGDVIEREITALDGFVDKRACVAFCSYWEPNQCKNTSIKNSIAAGCPFGGFVAPGNDCDSSDENSKFFKNVAHSVDGSGAYIYPDPAASDHNRCYEGSHFTAYKNQEQGLATQYKSEEIRMRDMIFVDNQLGGVSLNVAGTSDTQKIVAKNMDIYGESEAQDCPDENDKASCYCKDKLGFMLFTANEGGRALHPVKQSSLPVYKIKSYGAFGGAVELDSINFNDFEEQTKCGKEQRIIERNPYAADYIPKHTFTNTKFQNVTANTLAWLQDPNPSWAVSNPSESPSNCGNWPCTAPSNIVLSFEGTTFPDSDSLAGDADF